MTLTDIFDFFSNLINSIIYFIEQFFSFVTFLFTSLPFTLINFINGLPTTIASGIALLVGTLVVIGVLKLISIVRTK